jgi:hypothetical protein
MSQVDTRRRCTVAAAPALRKASLLPPRPVLTRPTPRGPSSTRIGDESFRADVHNLPASYEPLVWTIGKPEAFDDSVVRQLVHSTPSLCTHHELLAHIEDGYRFKRIYPCIIGGPKIGVYWVDWCESWVPIDRISAVPSRSASTSSCSSA